MANIVIRSNILARRPKLVRFLFFLWLFVKKEGSLEQKVLLAHIKPNIKEEIKTEKKTFIEFLKRKFTES